MSLEIERKFLVKTMPKIDEKAKIPYERHYLSASPTNEERIQIKGEFFEYETKTRRSNLVAEKNKKTISTRKFMEMKSRAIATITRDSYIISENPAISVKVYTGTLKGLIRAEVEFKTEEEAQWFKPPLWFGKEITGTPLASDGALIHLSKAEVKKLIKEYSK